MFVKIDGQLKPIKRIELTSDSTTFLIHAQTDTGMEEVYKRSSGSPYLYHLRNLLSSNIIF